jgi:hypothetical protein
MKRSYDDSDHARVSALRQLGETVDGIYMRAVVRLSRMSISGPGRKVLSKAQSAAYMPTAQYARHHLLPGDITGLATSLDMFEYALRARSIASPFAQTAPVLPVDLRDAVEFTCPQGHVISAWRCVRLEDLRDIAIYRRPMCDRILSRRPEHVAWTGGPDAHPAFAAATSTRSASPIAAEAHLVGFPIIGTATDTCGENAAPLSAFGVGRNSLSMSCVPRIWSSRSSF